MDKRSSSGTQHVVHGGCQKHVAVNRFLVAARMPNRWLWSCSSRGCTNTEMHNIFITLARIEILAYYEHPQSR